MARFRKITVQMWLGGSFQRLSPLQPSGQALWLYLLTNPDTVSIPGLYRCGEAQMAEALGWPMKAFRQAFAEVSAEGMAKADWKARVIWIPKAVNHDKPQSPNVVRGWGKWLEEIPECPLKVEAAKGLRDFLKGLPEGFLKAFGEAYREPSPNQESGVRSQESGEESPELPPVAISLAQYLYDSVLHHTPKFSATEKRLEGWARHIDRAMRLDNRTSIEIRSVIDFAHRDPRGTFWRANILSGAKLREKFDRLTIQMNGQGPSTMGRGDTRDLLEKYEAEEARDAQV